jgi:hypothetical protein
VLWPSWRAHWYSRDPDVLAGIKHVKVNGWRWRFNQICLYVEKQLARGAQLPVAQR